MILPESVNRKIVNLLTLRYDPSHDSKFLRKLTWNDITETNMSEHDAIKKLDTLLENSFEKLNGKKYVVSFSGGLDSTTIGLAAKQYLNNFEFVTMSFYGQTESLVHPASNFIGIDYKTINIDRVFERLPYHIKLVEEPSYNMWSYYLFEKSSKLGDSILSGDGGDELFGGYAFRYKHILSNEKFTDSKNKIMTYLEGHNRNWVPDQHKIFGPNLIFSWDKITSYFEEYFTNSLSILNQTFLADFNGKLLFDWLPMYNKWANHLNINLNSPFLDEKIISFAFSLPNHLKYDLHLNSGKLLLRKFLQTKSAPKEIIDQDKSGFTFNAPLLWQKEGKEIFDNIMNKSRIIDDGLINKSWITDTLNSTTRLNDPRYIHKLLGILAVEIWYRIFITKEMSGNERL
ncbi:putative asparagine synthetase glutamine-hydrolyzing protein [Marine Group I thaumarchaeote SCGC AAA799-B03]|uniref:Putative asparagine synthetase glutamine-hydrolyzing protein n=1 Tax=Marine Group I thaumarchaeote SCGC AAA799-B03 TaxID=1502289 RepID=A0A087S923_9ARCH|nr:putative asparagine synthetase glutamine-hydrolyzing protein [Marine Group I thaumarchaeote SCGC AAA799-B03]